MAAFCSLMEAPQPARWSRPGPAAHRLRAPGRFHSPRPPARAHWMAWPVPRCSVCSTNCTPVAATAARTCSASWPITTKICVRGNHLAGRGDDVRQQRLAADLVQNLGPLRFQPRAFARGHDHDGRASDVSIHCWHHARRLRHPCSLLASPAAAPAGLGGCGIVISIGCTGPMSSASSRA